MTPPKATLYLRNRSIENWYFRSDSLCVQPYQKSLQHFPVSRLQLVSFIGKPKGANNDLFKLIEHGVSIAFFKNNGTLLGSMHAPYIKLSSLLEVAEQLHYNTALTQQFDLWKSNQQRHLASEIKRYQLPVKVYSTPAYQFVSDWLEGLARVQLFQAGTDFQLSPNNKYAGDLLKVIEDLVGPWLKIQVKLLLVYCSRPNEKTCIDWFQRNIQDDLIQHQRRILVQLDVSANQWL